MDREIRAASGVVLELGVKYPGRSVVDLIPMIIADHMKDGCKFWDGASERLIAGWISIGNPTLEMWEGSPTMTRLCTMLAYEEKFCPREGIDKEKSLYEFTQAA